MKVLTIQQPWASLIVGGYKRFEFRSWKTKYRGDLLIHAGQGIDKEAMKRLKKYLPDELPCGEIIGKVRLEDCIKTSEQFYQNIRKENADVYAPSIFEEEYAWQLENIQKLEYPIKIKGKLGLWNYEMEGREK